MRADAKSLQQGTELGVALLVRLSFSKAGVAEAFEAHGGAVTSLQFHPAASESDRDLSQLLLSASVDWSVKLWSGSVSPRSPAALLRVCVFE